MFLGPRPVYSGCYSRALVLSVQHSGGEEEEGGGGWGTKRPSFSPVGLVEDWIIVTPLPAPRQTLPNPPLWPSLPIPTVSPVRLSAWRYVSLPCLPSCLSGCPSKEPRQRQRLEFQEDRMVQTKGKVTPTRLSHGCYSFVSACKLPLPTSQYLGDCGETGVLLGKQSVTHISENGIHVVYLYN